MIDNATHTRKGEELAITKLNDYLKANVSGISDILEVKQFPGGFSNLTYLLKTVNQEYVLRKPPKGANIKSAHDMQREFNVLRLLAPTYKHVPRPIVYCADKDVIGDDFYLMERVKGVILRRTPPKDLDLSSETMQSLSTNCINALVNLHQIDIEKSGLSVLGKPEGYTKRQVSGWIERYKKAATEEVKFVERLIEWLPSNIPASELASLIHNDYKYDNLVLEPEDISTIKAILDWEMATIGNPLMDLGTSLAYWAEANDHDALKPFNLTWLEGNLVREEVISLYFQQTNVPQESMLFYYVFGCFKIAVIVQQIYARYKKGLTQDERFKHLNFVVKAMSENATLAIDLNRISHLY